MAKPQIPNFEETFKPFMAYAKLATEAAEKAFKMQMDSTKAYAKVGMDNMADGFKVTNFEQMTAYAEKQKDILKKTSDMMVADFKEYSAIGAEFVDSSRTMMEDTIKSSVAAATEATKAATKAATAK